MAGFKQRFDVWFHTLLGKVNTLKYEYMKTSQRGKQTIIHLPVCSSVLCSMGSLHVAVCSLGQTHQ